MITQYLAEYTAQRGIAPSTENKMRRALQAVDNLVNLDTATEDDLLKAISKIRNNKEWSHNYSRELIKTVKMFALWKYPDSRKLKGIKLPPVKQKTKSERTLLKRADIKKLIKACGNPRDRAFIAMIYDGSNRPGELLQLNWGDITFDEYGAEFRTPFKTGRWRIIRLTFSVEYLKKWHQAYPLPLSPDSPVFLTVKKPYNRITRPAIWLMLEKLSKKTGIKVTPSLFRPSRITHDIEDGYDQSYIMLKNWGHLATKMIDTYADPSEDYVRNYALQKTGRKPLEEIRIKDTSLDSIPCPHCHAINAPTDLWCSVCLKPITDEARTLEEKILAEVHETKVYKEYERRIAQLEKDLAELKSR